MLLLTKRNLKLSIQFQNLFKVKRIEGKRIHACAEVGYLKDGVGTSEGSNVN
jgi:hypothetical protein